MLYGIYKYTRPRTPVKRHIFLSENRLVGPKAYKLYIIREKRFVIYCKFFILYFSLFVGSSHSSSKVHVVERPFRILLYPCKIFVFFSFSRRRTFASTQRIIVFGRFRATTRALVVYTARNPSGSCLQRRCTFLNAIKLQFYGCHYRSTLGVEMAGNNNSAKGKTTSLIDYESVLL